MNATKAAVLEAILAEPANQLHKLGMADLLLEEGATSLGHAYRWMAGWGKCPHRRTHYYYHDQPPRRVPERYGWAWYPSWADHRKRSFERIHETRPRWRWRSGWRR